MSDRLHIIQGHYQWRFSSNFLTILYSQYWNFTNMKVWNEKFTCILRFFLPPLRQLTRGWTLMLKSEMWSICLSHFISWLLPAISNNLTIFQKLKNNKRRLISLETLWLVVVSSDQQLQTKIRLYCTDFTRLWYW